jgi:hypothetical protein
MKMKTKTKTKMRTARTRVGGLSLRDAVLCVSWRVVVLVCVRIYTVPQLVSTNGRLRISGQSMARVAIGEHMSVPGRYLLPRPYVCAAVAVEDGATARAPLSVWPTGGVGSASAQGVANLAQAAVGRHDAISWAVNGRLRRERRPCSIAALEINSTQRDTHEVGVVGAPVVCIRGVRVTVCSIADFPSTVTQPHQGR